MAYKFKKLLKTTTDSRTYNIAFSHFFGRDWLEDKRNYNYKTNRKCRPLKSWKTYRKTQYYV